MSLVDQATENKLPIYQAMDKETLQWIIQNNPLPKVSFHKYKFNFDILDKLNQFTPKTEWFLNERTINGIHGLRHLLRVSALALKIAENNHIEEDKIINLIIAASLHDIRRNNDNGDKGHGERCSEWFLNNKVDILTTYRLENKGIINPELISKIIFFHDIDSESIKSGSDESILLDILRSSDGLDRYRQPKLKWWPDFNRFKSTPLLEDQAFAYNLVVSSEEKYLQGFSSIDAVISSIKELISQ